jgi:hypothetical protein
MESQINRLSRSGFALTSQAVDECDMYNKTHYAIWHNSREKRQSPAELFTFAYCLFTPIESILIFSIFDAA